MEDEDATMSKNLINNDENLSSVDETSIEDDDYRLVCHKKNINDSKNSSIASLKFLNKSLDIDNDNLSDNNAEQNKMSKNLVTAAYSDEVCNIMYGQVMHNRAIQNLILFTILMFTVPFVVFYFTYNYFSIAYSRDRAMLYAGIVAGIMVYVIVAVFIWFAYIEEKDIAKEVKDVVESKKKS